MMKGLTLTQLALKIEGNKALKQDYLADTRALTMQVETDGKLVLEVPTGRVPALLDTGLNRMPLLELAHGQIGDRLKIPNKYYDRMLAEAPDLLATNVNAWFR